MIYVVMVTCTIMQLVVTLASRVCWSNACLKTLGCYFKGEISSLTYICWWFIRLWVHGANKWFAMMIVMVAYDGVITKIV